MHISVVIPSYNTADTLGGTVDALQAQVTACDYEVIVVDCSDDDSVVRLLAGRDKVRVIRREQRFNPGEGRNIGAGEAQGDLLVFVDADVRLKTDALENAWRFYGQGNRAFGGALELDETHNPTVASYLEHYFFNHESQAGRPVCPRNNLSSALMLLDRALFLGEGGFRDIPRMQDTEFTERLRAKGVELTFTPSVCGYQIQDSPLRKVLRKIYLNGRNLYFIRYREKIGALKKVAFLLFLPVLSLLKIARIIARHLRYQTARQRLVTVLLVPLFLLSGIYWMSGLYNGALFASGISRER